MYKLYQYRGITACNVFARQPRSVRAKCIVSASSLLTAKTHKVYAGLLVLHALTHIQATYLRLQTLAYS